MPFYLIMTIPIDSCGLECVWYCTRTTIRRKLPKLISPTSRQIRHKSKEDYWQTCRESLLQHYRRIGRAGTVTGQKRSPPSGKKQSSLDCSDQHRPLKPWDTTPRFGLVQTNMWDNQTSTYQAVPMQARSVPVQCNIEQADLSKPQCLGGTYLTIHPQTEHIIVIK